MPTIEPTPEPGGDAQAPADFEPEPEPMAATPEPEAMSLEAALRSAQQYEELNEVFHELEAREPHHLPDVVEAVGAQIVLVGGARLDRGLRRRFRAGEAPRVHVELQVRRHDPGGVIPELLDVVAVELLRLWAVGVDAHHPVSPRAEDGDALLRCHGSGGWLIVHLHTESLAYSRVEKNSEQMRNRLYVNSLIYRIQ